MPIALPAVRLPNSCAYQLWNQLPQSRRDDVMRAVYTGRACTPEEVAEGILWLGSASPEYLNGATIDVNNGSYPR